LPGYTYVAQWFNGKALLRLKVTPREPEFARRFCLSPDVGEAPPHRREPSKKEYRVWRRDW
jgi:hypothetical protein